MQKYIIFILFFLIFNISYSSYSPNWGPNGHRSIGEIAEKNLNKKVLKKINVLLDGHSLAYVSTFADEIKSNVKYKKFTPWHYVNFPFNSRYEDSKKSPYGDVIFGINTSISKIKDKNTSKEEKVFYLKMLVHLVGDLHQPLHVGRAEDRGGNDILVKWHGKDTNIHHVWDEKLIDKWNMSYTEMSDNMKPLNKKQIKAIQQGSVEDWAFEIQKSAIMVYNTVKNGDKLSYRYSYDHLGLVKTQLQKGGLRLAKILNEIFS